MLHWYDDITERLRAAGDWLAPLGIRLLLFYEFWTAGRMKVGGNNWFGSIEDKFPIPFSWVSTDINWLLSTWTELTAGVALLLGLFTRFFAFALLVLTAVAILTVHWPADWSGLGQLWEGYSVSRVVDEETGEFRGNFRIPFLFIAMLLPLVFMGGGKLSVDHLLLKFSGRAVLVHDRTGDMAAFGFACLVIGVPLFYLMPVPGVVALVLAFVSLTYPMVKNHY